MRSQRVSRRLDIEVVAVWWGMWVRLRKQGYRYISKLVKKLYIIVMRGRWSTMPAMTNDGRVVELPRYGDVVSEG